MKRRISPRKQASGLLTASPFLLPSLIGMLIFSVLPLIISGMISLTDWNYVNGILKAWKTEGVKTIGDVQSRDDRRKPPAGQQQKPSAKDDYDAIFGGLG